MVEIVWLLNPLDTWNGKWENIPLYLITDQPMTSPSNLFSSLYFKLLQAPPFILFGMMGDFKENIYILIEP